MSKLQYNGVVLLLAALAAGWFQSAGFYQAEMRNGRNWLIAPGGGTQLLLAANHIRLVTPSAPRTDLEPAYVDERTAAIVTGLKQEGFNAIGGDADADVWHHGLPYIQSLDLASHLQSDQQTPAVDVYAADFRPELQSLVEQAVGVRMNDPQLIGYVSDEGLSWDPATHPAAALAYYLTLPMSDEGRQRAADYLRLRYHDDVRGLNRAWGIQAKDFITAEAPPNADQNAAFLRDASPFAERVLVTYVQAAANAIHQADPNHLYLGANLGLNLAALPRAGTDAALVWGVPNVASVRLPPGQDATATVRALAGLTSKPILVRVDGCTPQPGLEDLPQQPQVLGYVWTPNGDWQSGTCAAEAAEVWRKVNLTASSSHGAATAVLP